MPNVFNHATNDDMFLCQLTVFHSFKDDIFSIDRLGSRLADVKPITTFNVFNLDVIIVFFTFKPVEFSSYNFSIIGIKRLHLKAFFLTIFTCVVFFEDSLGIFHVVCYNIAIVIVLVVF